MTDIRDVIVTKLQEWARGLAEKGHVDHAYVFGSLTNGGGWQFTPESSDVDLILRIPPSSRDPLQRLGILDALVKANLELETALLRVLGRDGTKPITSITPVTEFELRFGVHKGGEPEIYSTGIFLDLLKVSNSPGPLTRTSHLKYEDHKAGVAGLKGAQKFRNQYIAVAANASRFVSDWSGDKDGASQLALPKDIARAAAQFRYYRDRLDNESRYDVDLGIDTLNTLVRERAKNNKEYKNLVQWLAPRRGGPGTKSPLSPRHQMLLWEVLAVAAEKALEEAEGEPALEPGDRITQVKLARAPSPALAQLSQPDAVVFARVIKLITTALELDRWSWFIDHAVRELVHSDSFNARGVLNACLLSTIWPKEPAELVKATKAVIKSFSNYITYYETNAENRGSHYGPNKAYRRFMNRRFDEFATFEAQWSDHCYWLLCKFVVDLNRFADMVRKHVDPMFFIERGHFLVEDSMGYRSGLTPMLYRPTAEAVEEGLRKYPPPTPPSPLERHRDEVAVTVPATWPPPPPPTVPAKKKAGTRHPVRSVAAGAPTSAPGNSTESKSRSSRAEGSSEKAAKPKGASEKATKGKSTTTRAKDASKKATKGKSTTTRAKDASKKAAKSKSARTRR